MASSPRLPIGPEDRFMVLRMLSLAAPLVLLAASLSPAENPPQVASFGERVDVEVVSVDVVVTDRAGQRITDLGRDDFELRIDGQPVAVEYFAAPRGGALAARRGAGHPPASPVASAPAAAPVSERIAGAPAAAPLRYLVVFIDQSALEARTAATLIDEIREFVIPQLDGTLAVVVAAYVDSLRVLGPVSTEVVEVDRALSEAKRLRGRGTGLVAERNRLELEIRASTNVPLELFRRRAYQDSERTRLDTELRQFAAASLGRQARSLAALRQWVRALASLEGRKSLLLATTGFTGDPASYLKALLDKKQQSMRVGEGGVPMPINSEPSNADSLALEGTPLADLFEQTVSAAENARVAFYTISPRTPPVVQTSPEFGGLGSETAQAAPRDLAIVEASSSVVRLSEATGGDSLYVDHDLSDKLVRAVDDDAAAYSLGFTTGEAAGGKAHRIEVRVKREGLTARHRESFRRRSLVDRAEEALAAAISLRAVTNPLGIAFELGVAKPDGKKGHGSIVPMLVRIPLHTLALAPEPAGLRGRLSARVAIQGADGEVRFGGANPLDIAVPAAAAARVATHVWPYRAELRLAPGANRVAVVIADELSGSFATAIATIDIPKP